MKANRRNAEETRDQLLDHALTLFSERGYAATGIRDITEAAGVTQPTLYYHFADKQTLFCALIERYYGESQQQLEEIVESQDECVTRLRLFAANSFESSCQDPRIPRLMFQTCFGPRIPEIDGVLDNLTQRRFGLVVRIMKEGMTDGTLKASDAEFLALSFCCLIDQPINLFSRRAQPRRYLTRKLADSLLSLFLDGALATRDG
jgi:AcrR family transcriptional regulator